MASEIVYKPRKGDAVAIEVQHSEWPQNGPVRRYTLWHLATIAEARRDGYVRRIIMEGSDYSIEAARMGRVHTIASPALQTAARQLIKAAEGNRKATEYATSDDIRAAIVARSEIATKG